MAARQLNITKLILVFILYGRIHLITFSLSIFILWQRIFQPCLYQGAVHGAAVPLQERGKQV
jgi:hypothetical protein